MRTYFIEIDEYEYEVDVSYESGSYIVDCNDCVTEELYVRAVRMYDQDIADELEFALNNKGD